MVLGDLETELVFDRCTVGVELGLVDHTPSLLLAVGHAAITTLERVEKELVLTSVHCNGDFMQISVEQPRVFPGSLSIFPFDETCFREVSSENRTSRDSS